MHCWQTKKQVTTTAISLTSKRSQRIRDKSLLVAFSHPKSPRAEIQGDRKKRKPGPTLRNGAVGGGREGTMRPGQIHFCSLDIRRQDGRSPASEELRVGHRVRAAPLRDKIPPHDEIPFTSVTSSPALYVANVCWDLSCMWGGVGGDQEDQGEAEASCPEDGAPPPFPESFVHRLSCSHV